MQRVTMNRAKPGKIKTSMPCPGHSMRCDVHVFSFASSEHEAAEIETRLLLPSCIVCMARNTCRIRVLCTKHVICRMCHTIRIAHNTQHTHDGQSTTISPPGGSHGRGLSKGKGSPRSEGQRRALAGNFGSAGFCEYTQYTNMHAKSSMHMHYTTYIYT